MHACGDLSNGRLTPKKMLGIGRFGKFDSYRNIGTAPVRLLLERSNMWRKARLSMLMFGRNPCT